MEIITDIITALLSADKGSIFIFIIGLIIILGIWLDPEPETK